MENGGHVTFDSQPAATSPEGWKTGVTGKGDHKWTVVADPTAPSQPNALKQSAEGAFPWAVLPESALESGFVETKFKAISGSDDQAAGVVWRFKDGANYYIARANALENNVSIYCTIGGNRKTIQYVDAPVPAGQWSTLRVEFRGKRFRVSLNGKTYIEIEDDRITGPGAVGLWTKADSVTEFDDFRYGL
jgi:hypothetical protein